MARVGLRPDVEAGGPRHMGARAIVGPGGGVQPVLDRGAQQLVVARVVVDLVEPVAVAVVGA